MNQVASMMEGLLAMMPPSLQASVKAMGEIVPRYAEAVLNGLKSAEEAGEQLGKEMTAVFADMKERNASEAS